MAARTREGERWWKDAIEICMIRDFSDKDLEFSASFLECVLEILKSEKPYPGAKIFVEKIDEQTVNIRLFFLNKKQLDYSNVKRLTSTVDRKIEIIVKHYPSLHNFKRNIALKVDNIRYMNEQLKRVQTKVEGWLQNQTYVG